VSSSRRAAIATESELVEGEAQVYQVGEFYIAVCKIVGKIYAVEDRCTHDDGPLGEGAIDGHEIECPRHGARFDVRSGEICRMPAYGPITTFPVTVENGFVFVDLPGS
jgi:3-phenylpropionate/trans-cinnamate dioxygenase ferredoxin subunit